MAKRQRSREFGVKLAKALRARAVEAAMENDLDSREVMLGATEYLRETAEFQVHPPIDPCQTDPSERANRLVTTPRGRKLSRSRHPTV